MSSLFPLLAYVIGEGGNPEIGTMSRPGVSWLIKQSYHTPCVYNFTVLRDGTYASPRHAASCRTSRRLTSSRRGLQELRVSICNFPRSQEPFPTELSPTSDLPNPTGYGVLTPNTIYRAIVRSSAGPGSKRLEDGFAAGMSSKAGFRSFHNPLLYIWSFCLVSFSQCHPC